MEDKDLIRLLRLALAEAGIFAHKYPPAFMPDDMDNGDFLRLYTDNEDDIFGERFIAYWIEKAKKEMSNINETKNKNI